MNLQPEEAALDPTQAKGPAARGAGWLDEPFKLGRYSVFGRVANGGMAEVLLALQGEPEGVQRLVAIKRILPHLAQNPEFVSMMIDEARLAARIRHVNVVQVHDYLVRNGQPHIVMEYLPGITLNELLKKLSKDLVRPDPGVAAHIIAEAAKGLHAAHELRAIDGTPLDVVHRDISPDNLFLTVEGSIKVLDFGIAKAARRLTHTEHGQLKGRLRYMSPEQIAAKPLDRRSDIYSLGVVLAEAATGRRFFANSDPTLAADERVDPETPDGLDDYPELARIVERATQRRARDRYPSIEAMRLDLEAYVLATDAVGLDREIAAAVAQVAPGSERWEQSIHKHGTTVIFASEPEATSTTVASPATSLRRSRAWALVALAITVALGVVGFQALAPTDIAQPTRTPVAAPVLPQAPPESQPEVVAPPEQPLAVVESPSDEAQESPRRRPRRPRSSMGSASMAAMSESPEAADEADSMDATMRPDWNVFFDGEDN